MCDQYGLVCVYTSKLFYNRFTSSITIGFPTSIRDHYENDVLGIRELHNYAVQGPLHESLLTNLRKANLAYTSARTAFITDLFAHYDESFPDTTEYRMNKASVTFYLDDPTKLAPVIESHKEMIVKVTVPRNEAEIAFLRTNTDKKIRDKYFFDQYPYKITFKHSRSNDYLSDYIFNQFSIEDGNYQNIEQDRAYYYCSNLAVLYLSDFTDLIITQIGVQDLIDKVEEIVLRA